MINDTYLDDRDAGLCSFGESGLIVTSFNNTVAFQRSLDYVENYSLVYLDKVSPELEEKYLGTTFRVSFDNGVTFGPLYKSPITSPHGPVELRDGTILWVGRSDEAKRAEIDGILAYMYTMIRESEKKLGRPFTRQDLVEKGINIVLFPGVEDWFRRINEFGESQGVQVEHYIISSGLKEIIEGCPISREFKEIYASEFYYDESGTPVWPKLAVNFTAKTQFVYRINKGVLDVSDDKTLNDSMPDDSKRVPFTNMIYFGDGLSDVPCMKMMRAYGGQAIAVYQETNRMAVEDLMAKHRVDFIFKADYSEGTPLDLTVKNIIRKMAIVDRLGEETNRQLRTIGGDVLPNQVGLF